MCAHCALGVLCVSQMAFAKVKTATKKETEDLARVWQGTAPK